MLVFFFGLLFVLNSINGIKSKVLNTCGPDYFPCNDGSCVEKSRWCDAKLDCDDDSDEDYCFYRTAWNSNPNRCNQTLLFLCGDGRCIPAIGRCDGYSSCDDNSDEENCEFTSVLPSSTSPQLKETIVRSSTELNRDLETNRNLSDHENIMQADHAPLTEAVTIHYEVFAAGQSNTSSDIPNSILKHTDKVLVSVSSSGNVSNTTDLRENVRVKEKHQQALEFRDLLGEMLNTSQNVSTAHANPDTSRNSVSSDEPFSLEAKTGKTDTSINGSKTQSNNSHNFIHNQNNEISHTKHEKEEDIYKGYVKLRVEDFQKAKEKALHWLIHSRNGHYGWGEETARALIALRMDNSVVKTREDILMSKELNLKLFTLLSRNETKRIPMEELALYINALSASCDNPKDFYGHDLVNILRHRTDRAQESNEFVTPLVHLALCLNNASSFADAVKVRDMMQDSKIKIDIKALLSLAATCLSGIPKLSYSKVGHIVATELYHQIIAKGLPRNVYELALVTQALNEARINQDLWNRTEAMYRITHSQEKNGSFGDILSTYFAVPTLSGKSFLSIGKTCHAKDTDLVPVEVLKNGKDKMYINYSLRIGYPIEIAQTLVIMVQKNSSFMDIMRIAATINPTYEFKYDETEGKTRVYSIGGIANDAEKGLYWTPYVSSNSQEDLVTFEGDIRNFSPAREQIAFWRKRML